MRHIMRLAAGCLALSLTAATATAQVPPSQPRAQPRNPTAPAQTQANTNPTGRTAQAPASQRRSIVHHYGYPYPGYYHSDQSAGFRNPGGTGRFLEYYPPNNQFQVNPQADAVRVATFGGGGIPDRNEQLAAQNLGVAKYNAIQGHIDSMARPMCGVGFFGGF